MKILAIVNPESGSKNALSTYRNLEVEYTWIVSTPYVTEYPGHASEIIQTVSLDDFEAIVVFGGDGTIHEVLNGLMAREDGVRKPIGIIPLGTGNALMHDLDILTIPKAIDRIRQKNLFAIDILECTHPGGIIYSFNMLGWGIPVTINELAEKWRFLGKQRYNIASLIQLIKNPSWHCKISLDNTIIEQELVFFMTCNTMYTGNAMKIAPAAILDDAKMDVIVMKAQPWYKLLALFIKVFSGNHIYHPEIIYKKVERISVAPKKEMPLIIDGQQAGKTPVTIRILPKHIEIYR